MAIAGNVQQLVLGNSGTLARFRGQFSQTGDAIKVAILAAGLLMLSSTGYAQSQRDENLEPECSTKGSGMDPRCVGDTAAGGLSDQTTEREEEVITGEAARGSAVPNSRPRNSK